MDIGFFQKRIIGGMVGQLIAPSETGLTADDFDDTLDTCFTTCVQLEQDGTPISPELVAELASAESIAWVSEGDLALWKETANSLSKVIDAIRRVKKHSLAGFLKAETASIASQTAPSLADVRQLIQRAEKRFMALDDNFQALGSMATEVQHNFEQQRDGVTNAISTGFKTWDDMLLDGFTPNDLHVIVGLTGAGKTALALNSAISAAFSGKHVGFVSREMGKIENLVRLIASSQGIPRWTLRKNMKQETFNQWVKGYEQISQLPFYIDTTTSTIEALRVTTRTRSDKGVMDTLYVDYLQLLGAEQRFGTRAEEVAFVSRQLKEIAMENHIPVIALCQFNRSATNSSVFELISKIKESSGIEQDATSLTYVQLDRPETGGRERPKTIDAMLRVLKNRNGETHTPIHLDFTGETFSFSEPTY